MKYGVDYIDGVEIPQLVVTEDFIIQGKHRGTVHIESGTLTIQGELHGTLDVQKGTKVVIIGEQHGTVSISSGAEVIVYGELHGTTTIDYGSIVIVEEGGKLISTPCSQASSYPNLRNGLSDDRVVVIHTCRGGGRGPH